MKRNVNVITDLDGKKIVVIQDIIFHGKQNINWNEVELYLKKYVDDYFGIIETGDIVYIGKDLPYEFKGSEYSFMIMKENWCDIIYSVQNYSYGMMQTGSYIYMM